MAGSLDLKRDQADPDMDPSDLPFGKEVVLSMVQDLPQLISTCWVLMPDSMDCELLFLSN